MKSFEISKRKNKNGRRKFKAILYRIFPDSCIDEVNEVGTDYNKNGITWIREYCEKALPSIQGMSLRCEFIDENRTELCGHGETGETEDGELIFENAVQIGVFTKGYIKDIETDDGVITVCIGEGEIDALCYNNFVNKLDEDLYNDNAPFGSVEIMRTEENDKILYKYGYKAKGRIPTEFIHSGYALLGVAPADNNAVLVELNENKNVEEKNNMNENEIKALISQVVGELNANEEAIAKIKSECEAEIEKIKAECEAKIAEVQADCEAKVTEASSECEKVVGEKNELVASSEQIQKALDDLRAEWDELNKKYDSLWEERNILERALGEAKARERIGEMNAAIKDFSEEEKGYAAAEINAFNENPIDSDINVIVNKIWAGIGRNTKVTVETNSMNGKDIFAEVIPATNSQDCNIF